MELILLYPIFTPFLSALLCLISFRNRILQAWMSFVGMSAMLYFSFNLFLQVRENGIVVLQAGNWNAPFGITLVADLLSAVMLILTAFIGLIVAIYSIPFIDNKRKNYGYFPLYNFLIFGVSGAFVTGDIFNLYVWFEIMLISSFVLLVLGGKKSQLEGAIKYVTLNVLSSAIFLAGVGMVYGLTGTLNMADLAEKVHLVENKGLITLTSMFFLISFGIKAAIFPLFFWLPASYHTPPVAVAAVFAGLLTKVGIYSLIRVFTMIFILDINYTHTLLLFISVFTMTIGVLGAATQYDFRRVLSFHSVSQIGFMVMGLALFTPLALAGSIFYIVHHSIVKTNLFLISGIVHHLKGSYKLKYIGGVYRDYPWLAFLFLIPALSLAGIPPFSGFWAKFLLVKAGIEAELFWLIIIALAVGLLTLFSMTKIWNEVFWTNEPEKGDDPEKFTNSPGPVWMMVLPVGLMVLATIIIGIIAEPFYEIAMETAEQLFNSHLYIHSVLNPR